MAFSSLPFGVALLGAQDGGTQRGLLREDLQIGACGEGVLNLAGTEQELQVAARHLGLDDHAQGYNAIVDGGVANLGGLQQVLELLDACLVLGLLVAGSVVAAVLAEVTLVACLSDAVDDFLTVRAGEVLQFLSETVEGVLSEPCTGVVSHAYPLLVRRRCRCETNKPATVCRVQMRGWVPVTE